MAKYIKDISGMTFGEWTVLSLEPKNPNHKTNSRYWLCRCSCGIQRAVRRDVVVSGHSSCGHSHPCHNYGNMHVGWKGCGELSASHWKRILHAAKQRNLDVTITIQQAWELFVSQDGKCAITKLPLVFGHKYRIVTASLDRKDSSKGYIPGNLQWVHKRINIMKGDLSDNEFVELCKLVAMAA